ncbi:DNA repair protein RecN [Alcaligenes endophyticus]|uniref:DNA repair protein RecN n=1 Tax=Alcaligenes endophyticus TaxID=1929088 RepID=A0ABT8EH99_9BURK|nr:DNA repair protein RecN [Alcaligenes endophyticus]MCX5589680.1 DNA repair protein RecN [Alcaligenes endophyticus]MDN4120656.1 DNA repair protein RecN [Alcaligenes endophyticus]
MLRTLHIRDFVIVDQATIEFESGFTVFTGETGAGKSILIDALSLALGGRGDSKAIREGCPRTEISASFECTESARAWLLANALDIDDDLVLRRVIDQQGRNRSYINGSPATLAQLRELGQLLLDIHGQHAHQSLMQGHKQTILLDTQGGHLSLARKTEQAWQQHQYARKALEQAQQQAETAQHQQQQLEWQIQELSSLNLQEGEWEQLQQEHTRLSHAQTLLDSGAIALDALDGEVHSALRLLHKAKQEIAAQLKHDPELQSIYEALESAHITSSEAVSDLNSYLSNTELDNTRLAQLDERVSLVFNAARRFKLAPEELPALLHDLEQQLLRTQQASDLEHLQRKFDTTWQNYLALAQSLSAARLTVSQKLSSQVTEAMQTLAMEGGSFAVQLHANPAGPQGLEHVEFLVAGHQGSSPRPLNKVASGGELARISLALSVIASQAAQVPTLIFDEVDTGVGGAVAEVVGRLLLELGKRHQVLCVTHLPQVAACGEHQFKVEKHSHQGQTLSSIAALNQTQRTQEIARMLGGLEITATTLEHASEMLQRQSN